MSKMISSTTTIQVVLAAAPATNQLPCTSSWMDQGGLGGDNTTNTNGTTAVTLVAAPAASVERLVTDLSICNTDTANATVTINKVVSGTASEWAKFLLPPGYRASYDSHWRVMDPNGNFCETVTVTSGTLTANQGTAAAIAAPWPVELSNGTTAVGTPSAPLRIDPTGTTTQPVSGAFFQATQPVSGTVTANQGTSPWVVSLASTTVTGTVAVTQSTSPWTIQGDSASGAANAGNPVKVGGVFNTTQPTVTTGQTVDAQATARGAMIVSTGVDTFNVTVNAALPAGANAIGVVQAVNAANVFSASFLTTRNVATTSSHTITGIQISTSGIVGTGTCTVNIQAGTTPFATIFSINLAPTATASSSMVIDLTDLNIAAATGFAIIATNTFVTSGYINCAVLYN